MLHVFLTIDTEAWPFASNWRESGLAQEIAQDIYGVTPEGEFGLRFQLDLLNKYRLKAVFFVETLFPYVVGLDSLDGIVKIIQDYGHEIQLHIHTEWLEKMIPSILPAKTGQNIRDFTFGEQALLIERGIQNLRACGIKNPCAFRAGNLGANFDTLRALHQNGILFDTSYSISYLDSSCGIQTPEMLLQPKKIHGVYEFPISFFRDYPNHYRHTQLGACSFQELERVLIGAWKRGWYSFVLLSHSHELVKRRSQFGNPASADWIVIKRFERLCHFLDCNRDKFVTTTFSEIVPEEIPDVAPSHALFSSFRHTAMRMVEQLVRRTF